MHMMRDSLKKVNVMLDRYTVPAPPNKLLCVPLRNGLETQSKVAKRIDGIKTGKTGRFVSYCPPTII